MSNEYLQLRVTKHVDSSHTAPSLNFIIESKIESPFSGSQLYVGQTEAGQKVVAKFSAYPYGRDHEWTGLRFVKPLAERVQQAVAKVEQPQLGKGLLTQFIAQPSIESLPDDVWRFQAGQVLRQIHQLAIPIADKHWPKKQSFSHYQRVFEHAEKSTLPELRKEAWAIPLLNALRNDAEARLQTVWPVFCHQDLHDEQILQREANVTLIDFENWSTDDPLTDLAMYLFHTARLNLPESRAQALLAGYQTENFQAQEQNAIAFYALALAIRSAAYFELHNRQFLPGALTALQNISQSLAREWLWKLKP